jgi:hypothetical protein
MGIKRHLYRILVGKPEGRRPVGRPRHRWMDNINVVTSKSVDRLKFNYSSVQVSDVLVFTVFFLIR